MEAALNISKNVLLLEEDNFLANEIVNVLRISGFQTTVFADLTDAFAAASVKPPDIFLASWNTFGMNGRSMIRQMRHFNRSLQSIPAVLMTDREIDGSIRQRLSGEGYRWLFPHPISTYKLPRLLFQTIAEAGQYQQYPFYLPTVEI